MDASQPGGLGGTFGGNPVSCAAAIAVFEQIESRDLLAEAARIESAPCDPLLDELQAKYPVIAEVRGIGAMLAIELLDPETHEPRPRVVNAVAAYAAQQGVLRADRRHLRQRPALPAEPRDQRRAAPRRARGARRGVR